ncbi:hypothetical protein RHSIM_Rhsim07G0187400 [Rhododendron simsii]|uniref:Uncharacterized protein n=1 Tax=Rhododendron simsii TaxID=118357 RepID=A0A834LFN1_RHOSS|nr:hypothetical protein RHSIM_Rhsim07G0187400 [Rhododendron simsii]
MDSSEQGYGSDEQVTKRARLTPEVDSSKEEYISELLVPSGADNEKAGEEQFAKHARITAEVPPSGDMVCPSPPAVPWRKTSATIGTGIVCILPSPSEFGLGRSCELSIHAYIALSLLMSSSAKPPPSEMPPSVLQRFIFRKPDGSTRTLTLRRELPVFKGAVVHL